MTDQIIGKSLPEAKHYSGIGTTTNLLAVYLETAQQLIEAGDLWNVIVLGLVLPIDVTVGVITIGIVICQLGGARTGRSRRRFA